MNARESVQYIRSIGLDLTYSKCPRMPWRVIYWAGKKPADFATLGLVWRYLEFVAKQHLRLASSARAIVSAAEQACGRLNELNKWAEENNNPPLPSFAYATYRNHRDVEISDDWSVRYANLMQDMGLPREPLLPDFVRHALVARGHGHGAVLTQSSIGQSDGQEPNQGVAREDVRRQGGDAPL